MRGLVSPLPRKARHCGASHVIHVAVDAVPRTCLKAALRDATSATRSRLTCHAAAERQVRVTLRAPLRVSWAGRWRRWGKALLKGWMGRVGMHIAILWPGMTSVAVR